MNSLLVSNRLLLNVLKNARFLNATCVRFSHDKSIPRKYNSWKDVPDNLVKKFSEEDPDNGVYQHPDYIKHKKMQIFYQQDDSPTYLRFGFRDKVLHIFCVITTFALFFYYLYFEIKYFFNNYKPDK